VLSQVDRMRATPALTLSALASLAGAIHLDVGSSGGIASSPLQYGVMFEVGENLTVALTRLLIGIHRTSITPATAEFTPN